MENKQTKQNQKTMQVLKNRHVEALCKHTAFSTGHLKDIFFKIIP